MAKYSVTMQWDTHADELLFDEVQVNDDGTLTFAWIGCLQGEFTSVTQYATTANTEAWRAYLDEYVDPADVKV